MTHSRMTGLFVLLVSILGMGGPTAAHAAPISPLGVSIIPPVQFPPGDFYITGARLNVIWGKHRRVYGLDVGGIGNITEQAMAGIQVAGGFNLNQGTVVGVGLQAAGLANVNNGRARIVGAQLAGLFNSNKAETTVIGVQASLANLSPFTTIGGVQLGIYNRALVVYGLQIGLVNHAKVLHGIQIGLINFHTDGLFAVAPILNVGF